MKKWLKLWMLAVAFVAAMTAVVSTGKVEATGGQDNSKKVQVTINEYNSGNNTCELENYEFTFDASTEVQYQTTWHDITCKFWDSAASTVTLQLNQDLSNWSAIISSGNVTLNNGTWTADPDTLGNGASYNGQINGSVWETLFNKVADKIWNATWANVQITVEVPGWTPHGTYQGTLVLTF